MENKPLIPGYIIFFIICALIVLVSFVSSIIFSDKVYGLAGVSVGDYLLATPTEKAPTIVITTPEKPPVTPKPIVKVESKVKEEKKQETKELTLGQKAGTGKEFTPQDIARLERVEICQEMYEKHKERITYNDNVVIRCATMMTLQYAFESGHGKSKKCVNQRNCYGIKNNSRDRCIKSKNGFCTYSAQIEGSRDYAEMFMKHYEGYKSVTAYLHVYSPDGNTSYHKFVLSKYQKTLEWFKNNPAF